MAADSNYYIDLIIRARDNTGAAIAKAMGQTELLAAAQKRQAEDLKKSNEQLDTSFDKLSRTQKQLRDETINTAGTIARRMQQADKEAKRLSGSMAEQGIKIREARNEVEKYERAAEKAGKKYDELSGSQGKAAREAKAQLREQQDEMGKLAGKMDLVRQKQAELNNMFSRDERANAIERQVVAVQKLADRQAALARNEKATTQERINLTKDLEASTRDLQIMMSTAKTQSEALKDTEARAAAQAIRDNQLVIAQQREILELRRESQKIGAQLGRADDPDARADLLRRASAIDDSLRRLQVETADFEIIQQERAAREIAELRRRGNEKVAAETERINRELEQTLARMDQATRVREEQNLRAAAAANRERIKQEVAAEEKKNKERIRLERDYAKAIGEVATARTKRELAQEQGKEFSESVFRGLEQEAYKKAKEIETALSGIEVTMNVDADIGKAVAKIVALRELASAGSGGDGGGDGFGNRVMSSFHDAGSEIAGFDNLLRGLLSLGVAVFFNQLIVLAGAAAGALGALASSAAQAGAALGGALTSGLAQAMPALGLFAAALARFKSVTDAVQQANLLDQQQSAGRVRGLNQQAAATDAVTNASEALADAQRRVIDSQDRVADAQRRLSDARKDARRDLEDLILAEREAELAARGASLSQKEAQEALRRAIREGRTEDIQRAQLRVDETGLGVTQANRALSRTRTDASAARAAGVSGAPGVIAAREALDDAREAVADAQRGVARAARGLEAAKRSAAQAGVESLAAAGKLEYLLGQLSAAERRLYGALRRLQTEFRDFAQETTAPIIDSFTYAINRITQLMGSGRVREAFLSLGTAMSASFDRMTDAFLSDEMVGRWIGLMEEFERNLTPLTNIAINLGRAFMGIAETAQPALRIILDYFDDLIARAEEFTNSVSGQATLERFFTRGAEMLVEWVKLLGSIANLFLAIAGPGGGAETGVDLVSRLTELINGMAESIRKSPDGMRDFFATTKQVFEALLPIFGRLLDFFNAIFGPTAVKNIEALVTILDEVLLPVFEHFLKTVGLLGQLIAGLAQNPLTGRILQLSLDLIVIGGLLMKVGVLLKPVAIIIAGAVTGLTKLAGGGGPLAKLVATLTAAKGALLGGVGGRGGGMDRGPGGLAMRGVQRVWVVNFPPSLGGRGVPPLGGGAGPDDDPDGRRGRRGGGLGSLARRLGPVAALAGIYGAATTSGDAVDRGLGAMRMLDPTALFGSGLTGQVAQAFGRGEGQSKMAGLAEAKKKFDELGAAFRKAFGEGSQRGMREAQAQIKRFIESGPVEAREAFQKLLDKNNEVSRALRKSFNTTDRTITLGMELQIADGDKRKSKRAINDFLKDLWDNNKDPQAREAGKRQALAMIDGLVANKDLTKAEADKLKTAVVEKFDEMAASTKRKSEAALERQQASANAILALASKGQLSIVDATNRILDAYGVGPVKGLGNIGGFLNKIGAAGLAGLATTRRAVGGFVGNPGERGHDAIHTVLGRGEVVLNAAQQAVVNSLMGGQATLASVVGRTRGYHAGGPDAPGFAGGYAGKSPAGLKTVPIPGFPGEFIAQRVLGDAMALIRRFKLFVTDAFATSGHRGAGHLRFGTAIDVTPRDGNWDNVDRAVAFARSKGLTVLYNGVPGHGRGHHAHIELQPGLIGGMVPDISTKLKREKFDWPYGGATGKLGQKVLDRIRSAAQKYIDEKTSEIGATNDPAHGPRGANILTPGEVRSVIARAMGIVNVPDALRSAWASMAFRRARQESSFNANAINNWDINARRGDPSRGLFQTISGTFNAHKLPGLGGITNPLANTVAAFRYMLAQYGRGNWQTALQRMLGREGVGYATGGVLPGDGEPMPILAHGGEWILNKSQQARAAALSGLSIGKLKSALGFTGGPTSFQGGGEVPGGWINDRLRQLMGRAGRGPRGGSTGSFTESIEKLTNEGGLFDQLEETFALRLRRIAIKVASKVSAMRQRGDEVGVLASELDGLQTQFENFAETQANVARAIAANTGAIKKATTDLTEKTTRVADLDARLAVLRMGKEDADERKEIARLEKARKTAVGARGTARRNLERLEAAKENLRQRELDAAEKLAEIQAEMAAKRLDIFKAQIETGTKAIEDSSRRGTGGFSLDNARKLNSLFGTASRGDALEALSRDTMAQKAAFLRQKAQEAAARGYDALARDLSEQVEDLTVAIAESIAQQTQRTIDNINAEAERATRRLGFRGRMADLAGRAGNAFGAAAARIGISQETGAVLAGQRAGLLGMLPGGQAEFERLRNLPLVELTEVQKNLISQIEELDLSIAENAQATRDLTANMIQAGIDTVTGRSGQTGGFISSAVNIFNRIGALSNDLSKFAPQIRAALEASGADLRSTATEIMNEVNRALAEEVFPPQLEVLLEGMRNAFANGPEAFAAFLSSQGAGIADILATLGPESQNAANALIQAMIGNTEAVLDNNEQLNNLNGAAQTQSWSSTSWQWFRNALFDGMGGLLPQYQIPQMHVGGYVTQSGVFDLQVGERVLTPQQQVGGGDINIEINEAGGPVDVQALAARIAFEKRTR